MTSNLNTIKAQYIRTAVEFDRVVSIYRSNPTRKNRQPVTVLTNEIIKVTNELQAVLGFDQAKIVKVAAEIEHLVAALKGAA